MNKDSYNLLKAVIFMNSLAIVSFVCLAAYLEKWWVALFAIIFISSGKFEA